MLLKKSIQDLLSKSGAGFGRLWGKIRGTKADYYILEGTAERTEETDPDMEARGNGVGHELTGVNHFVYWAANDASGPWTQLPDLMPQDIINARGIKHTFSGDLDAKIFTNPFYFETEKTYLRCQIARIALSTTLYPKGLLKFQEESTRNIEEAKGEDDAPVETPTTEAMTNLGMWIHLYPSILNQGKLKQREGKPTAEEIAAGVDVEPEELERREIAKDPWEPRLKPCSADNSVQGGLPGWVLRNYNVHGNVSVDTRFGKKTKNFGTVVVKSLWWPGAHNFFNGGKTQFLYVGDGLKHETVKYYPTTLPVMMSDRADKPAATKPSVEEEEAAKQAAADAAAAQQQ